MARNTTYILAGNTYPHRAAIKDIGGQWDATRKAWVVTPGTMAERARQSSVINGLRRHGVTIETA